MAGKKRFTAEQLKARKAAREKARRDARRALRPSVNDDTQKKLRNVSGVRFVPTPEQRAQVEAMVGYGLTYEEIASLVINPDTGSGISVVTLQKHFQTELQTGRAKMKAAVVQSLYRKAVSNDHPQAAVCAIFIAKCQLGWRQQDKILHQIEGVQHGVLLVPANQSPEDWVAEQQRKNASKKAPDDGDAG